MEINHTTIDHHHYDFHSLAVCRPETTALQNPRKRRTKSIRTGKDNTKPDPKITRPCTECGKKFWSWKALFGHMRCHPERQWRGINPPPNFRRSDHHHQVTTSSSSDIPDNYTEEDHEVATCLLMLANGPAASDQSPSVTTINQEATPEYSDPDLNLGGRFECSSCKKVFGSHQALGGHRASHKNVKGCYAITKDDGEEEDGCCSGEMKDIGSTSSGSIGHKCSICFRVFSSGQALGGHMRCHWEKVEEASGRNISCGGLDLNLQQNDDDGASSSSGGVVLSLDLRLGL